VVRDVPFPSGVGYGEALYLFQEYFRSITPRNGFSGGITARNGYSGGITPRNGYSGAFSY